ncbi:NmrA-like family domain-containing protein [Lachnellula subtilissima]|uniref:NmrA-like family domain-containing protein n=1 Tax=Lachnellula subtilissima TaxID=602034 RepID=A0A8H8S319_9HELO|nr:NmrA-like family domain-containing protein [Lachnellula subtilissima]
MAKTIAVLGATGNQGGAVASFFNAQGWIVRGISRSASSASSKTLISKGISVVEADIDDFTTLVSAFKGAHVIFAVTDFWAPFFEAYPKLSKVSDRATGEHALAIEVRRGKTIIDAATKVLNEEGILERFVFSTLPSFKEQSGGKYTYAYHFDAKAIISEYLKEHKPLWEKSSLLNMGFYTTNLVKMGSLMGAKKDPNGSKIIWRRTGTNEAVHPFVVPDDAGIFADLLVRSPPKQDLLGVSEMASYATYMNIWSEVTGVPSEVKQGTEDEADKAMPGGLGREAAESTSTSAEFGWGKHLVLPKDLDPNVKTTSLRSYFENEDWKPFLDNA